MLRRGVDHRDMVKTTRVHITEEGIYLDSQGERAPTITPEALQQELGRRDLRVVDCRFQLGDPDAGRRAYITSHVPGAVYLSLEDDLSAPVGPHGGRHPLPDLEALAKKLGDMGIDNEHHIVVYDNRSDMASRLWWMLVYMGHAHCQVLDGGFPAWQAKGFPVTAEPPTFPRTHFSVKRRPELLVDAREAVEEAARGGRLIDSRAGARYRGDVEPLDVKAGHIPHAINRDWQLAFDATGHLKPASVLVERFSDLGQEPVVYCGSGVTACANILAMTTVGLMPRLYLGSWSDWISYPDRPIATGPEHPDPLEPSA